MHIGLNNTNIYKAGVQFDKISKRFTTTLSYGCYKIYMVIMKYYPAVCDLL